MLPHAGSTSMDDDFSSKWKRKKKKRKKEVIHCQWGVGIK